LGLQPIVLIGGASIHQGVVDANLKAVDPSGAVPVEVPSLGDAKGFLHPLGLSHQRQADLAIEGADCESRLGTYLRHLFPDFLPGFLTHEISGAQVVESRTAMKGHQEVNNEQKAGL
jgi:hypothetical protein